LSRWKQVFQNMQGLSLWLEPIEFVLSLSGSQTEHPATFFSSALFLSYNSCPVLISLSCHKVPSQSNARNLTPSYLSLFIDHHTPSLAYLSLLASLSDSSRHRISSTLTGPLTFRIMLRLVSSMNSTLTCVTPPRDPVRPRTLVTLTSLTGTLLASILSA